MTSVCEFLGLTGMFPKICLVGCWSENYQITSDFRKVPPTEAQKRTLQCRKVLWAVAIQFFVTVWRCCIHL